MLCLASILSKGYSFGELSKFGVYICLVNGDDECESFMSVRIGGLGGTFKGREVRKN